METSPKLCFSNFQLSCNLFQLLLNFAVESSTFFPKLNFVFNVGFKVANFRKLNFQLQLLKVGVVLQLLKVDQLSKVEVHLQLLKVEVALQLSKVQHLKVEVESCQLSKAGLLKVEVELES